LKPGMNVDSPCELHDFMIWFVGVSDDLSEVRECHCQHSS
jgi:hypothetical protein